jgi:NifU-like protein involved in Fe-S cluster formation
MRLLWGEVALGTSRLRDEAAVLGRVREAIEQLSEPFKSFMRLDFIEGRSEEEIRLKLGLADHEEYLHLKRLSFSALRQAIERLLSSKPLRVVT